MCCITVGTQRVILKRLQLSHCERVCSGGSELLGKGGWGDNLTVTWLQCWVKGFKCHLVFGPYDLSLSDVVILIIVLPL